jgi:hypothetical protein
MAAMFVQAQVPEAPTEAEIVAAGITYPVLELGNCANQNECRAYCNDPANMSVCIAFAESRGLMNNEEGARARTFAERLQAGGTPGGCTSAASCEAYCSDITRIEECLSFAEGEGFDVPDIEEAKKIRRHLAGGGTMPGGCISRQSCEAYCTNFDHVDECIAFARTVGLEIDEELPPPEALELMKRGETPGGCRSREACEAYCQNPDNFETCIAFAEKAGFVKPEQAELARKTGGKGPGGCNSRESCEAYCNDPTHQEECFQFAEERGLIPEAELKQAKEGLVRLRAGLEQAPEEVRECMKSVLGPNIIEDIQAGRLTPGPQIGERMRACFEKFGARHDTGGLFQDAPREVIACVEEKLGGTFQRVVSGEEPPTPEIGDAFRICFQTRELERSGFGGPGPGGAGGPMVSELLRSAPPTVAQCLREKLGDRFDGLASGALQPTPDLGDTIRSCFESFRPPEGAVPPGFQPPAGGFPVSPEGGAIAPSRAPSAFPPEVIACVRQTLSPEQVERLLSGSAPTPETEAALRTCFGAAVPQTGTPTYPTPKTPEEPTPIAPQPSPYPSPYPTTGGEFEAQQQEQYQQEYQRQYEEQYRQQYEQQYQQQYPSGSYPPPSGTYEQPPPTAPQSRNPLMRLLGVLLAPIFYLLQ